MLDINNIFKKLQNMNVEAVIYKFGEYLNELTKNIYCNKDVKLYEFIFLQEVHFPNMERYDKVLSDAAVYSRKYLNSIFTRKSESASIKNSELVQIYQEFQTFSANFNSVKEFM